MLRAAPLVNLLSCLGHTYVGRLWRWLEQKALANKSRSEH
jgi:hypothetical protein